MKKIGFLSLDITNTFNELLYNSIYQKSKELGYNLCTIHGGRLKSTDQWEYKRNILYNLIMKQKFDGMIISNVFDFISDKEALEFLRRFKSLPIILISKRLNTYSSIIVNNSIGFEVMLNSVLQQNSIQRIAVIAGPENNTDTIERMIVLKKLSANYSKTFEESSIYYGTYNFYDGEKGVSYFIDNCLFKPDLIVCFNDNMAMGALSELDKRNISIPYDMQITGFDNTLESFFITPSLSTVTFPLAQIGVVAMESIDKFIKGVELPEVIELPTFYIPRRSTGDMKIVPPHFAHIGDDKFPFNGSVKDIRRYVEVILKQYPLVLSEAQKKWLYDKFVKLLSLMISPENGESTINYIQETFFSNNEYRWVYPIIMEIFQKMHSESSSDTVLHSAEPLLLSYYHYSSFIIQRFMKSKIYEEQLFQLGEDISTAFNFNSIMNILSSKLSFLSIDRCFIVLYTDDSKERVRLAGYIRDGSVIPVSHISNYNSNDLLPEQFQEELSSFFMEALYIKDEDIGFLIINNGLHIGIPVKSLRHQISSAIKGTMLVDTINQYSISMEKRVRERTFELEKTNLELKEEIQKREKLEKNILKNKNLESLGLLAGGIAHDFNNYLTGILGNISLIKRESNYDSELNSCLEDIESVARNAIGLTQQLLTFSRGGNPIRMNISLVPLIQEITRFLLRGSSIRSEFFISPGCKNVLIDQNQISQVLHNIIINAIHSMNGKGILSVSLSQSNLKTDNEYQLATGEYLCISIADTGCGISEELLERIFDPYFSTKSDGSGLGLATSLTIIRKHGGEIQVSSKEGKGTKFQIFIPSIEKEAISYAKVRSGERLKRSIKILVLEDDEIISKVLCKIIEVMGHTHIATNCGYKAIEEFKNAKDIEKPFDLLILDLTIVGGLGGVETITAIREIDKTVKAVVSSGYSEESVLSEYKKYGFDEILQKPYTMSDIEKTINSLFR